MQSVSSRIWTRVAVSISYDDNHYTITGTKAILLITFIQYHWSKLPLLWSRKAISYGYLVWPWWLFCISSQPIYHHHHHHVVPLARISLTLSRHFSQSFIASSRSSELHPVSSHSCCMYVRDGRPAFTRPYVGSLLLQQCSACLARLTWIVFVMGGRWPYSWCLVGCCSIDK